jgi:hypothetical protein
VALVNKDSESAIHWEYVDFDLEIGEQRESRTYLVSVRSPEGEAQEEIRFPFDEWELKDRLRDVEFALLRSGGSRRRIGTPEEQTVQAFGLALFETLIAGDVSAHYRVSWREARRQNKGLRLKVHVRPPELSSLPWEFVYDPQHGYLCLSSSTPLVRYPDVPHPIERLTVAPPLRVLGMVASPQGLPQLDVGHEKRLVEEAVRGLRERRLVELAWLEGQTWRDLQRAMRRGPWHVFHFIGHGGFDPETEEGAIALSDDEGRKHLLGASDLALLLDDHYFLRLVFLNSCEGARGSPRDPFSSTAASLVRSGIPAVVAMQYEITDRSAIEFSRSFYDAVADGLPIDAAVAEARTAVKMKSILEWGTPVLYMRSSDGRIFDVLASGAQTIMEPEDPQQEDPLRRYREGVALAWVDGELQGDEVRRLRYLAKDELGLDPAAADEIEREVMGDTIEEILGRQEQEVEPSPAVEVPDLSGQEVSHADSMLAGNGLNLGTRLEVRSDTVPEGRIIGQVPGPRVEVIRGSSVDVTVSSGPSPVQVPDLAGKSRSKVRNLLRAAGLELGTVAEAHSRDVREGRVIEQHPETGNEVDRGTSVRITLSSGPQDLRGQAREVGPPGSQEEFSISDPIRSFARVVWQIVTEPAEFFSAVPRRGNLRDPLIFAIICYVVSAILGDLLSLIGTGGAQGFGGFTVGAPFLAVISLFVGAGVIHLPVMLIIGSRNSGFAATFRAVAYSSIVVAAYSSVVPLVNWLDVGWIQLIGLVIGAYVIYLVTVGIREVHSTTTGKAVSAVLMPAVVVIVFFLLLVLVLSFVFQQ